MARISAILCLFAATAPEVVAASLARLRSISEEAASGLASEAANRILGEWPCRLRQGRSAQISMVHTTLDRASAGTCLLARWQGIQAPVPAAAAHASGPLTLRSAAGSSRTSLHSCVVSQPCRRRSPRCTAALRSSRRVAWLG